MALLRLRPQEIELHAGNSRMLKISQYLREIDVLLLKFGQECKSCFRFEWEGQKKPEGMSELVYVLNCYLTGEAMSELIRIKTIADSNEAETKDE